jgi:hypothetical protein
LILFSVIILIISYNFFFYKPLKNIVKIEIGEKIPEAMSFLKDDTQSASFITDIDTINTNSLGQHTIEIKVGLFTKKTLLEIVDTIPPKGQGVNHEIWYDVTLPIEAFVTGIDDQTNVTLEYIISPDFSSFDKQNIKIRLIDEGNNITQVDSQLTIKNDTEAPKIHGVKDQLIFTNEPISYRRGVKVTDNKDQSLDFDVDNSNVDINKPGVYKAVYSCEDKAGNKSTKEAVITVKDKPVFLLTKDELNVRGDRILNQITTKEMNDLQILDAIFWYTRWNIKYTGQSDKTSWEIGASKALEEMEGDCFNYYSLAHLLLDRAGFEFKPIKRVEASKSRHYWLLVKHGDLWYHYDPTWSPTGYEFVGFMISESEAKDFTERVAPIRENYYVYDKSLYDDIKIADKPLIID